MEASIRIVLQKKDSDLLLQDIFEFKCNFANKLSDELEIDGKSSKRLEWHSGQTEMRKTWF